MTLSAKVINTIAEKLGENPNDIQPAHSLVKHHNCDSLDLIELTLALEKEFDIQIKDSDFHLIDTVQDAIDYIQMKVCT